MFEAVLYGYLTPAKLLSVSSTVFFTPSKVVLHTTTASPRAIPLPANQFFFPSPASPFSHKSLISCSKCGAATRFTHSLCKFPSWTYFLSVKVLHLFVSYLTQRKLFFSAPTYNPQQKSWVNVHLSVQIGDNYIDSSLYLSRGAMDTKACSPIVWSLNFGTTRCVPPEDLEMEAWPMYDLVVISKMLKSHSKWMSRWINNWWKIISNVKWKNQRIRGTTHAEMKVFWVATVIKVSAELKDCCCAQLLSWDKYLSSPVVCVVFWRGWGWGEALYLLKLKCVSALRRKAKASLQTKHFNHLPVSTTAFPLQPTFDSWSTKITHFLSCSFEMYDNF